jgi:hypothetical protein
MRQQYYFVYFHLPSRATFIYAIVPAAPQIKKKWIMPKRSSPDREHREPGYPGDPPVISVV